MATGISGGTRSRSGAAAGESDSDGGGVRQDEFPQAEPHRGERKAVEQRLAEFTGEGLDELPLPGGGVPPDEAGHGGVIYGPGNVIAQTVKILHRPQRHIRLQPLRGGALYIRHPDPGGEPERMQTDMILFR